MSKIIIFDLDGTLADISHRRHFVEKPTEHFDPLLGCEVGSFGWKPDWDSFHKACVDDKPNEAICGLYRAMFFSSQHKNLPLNGIGFEIWSGRDESVYSETCKWLIGHGLIHHKLRMRPHGDHCPDTELKKRWLDEVGKENVVMVFDDRKRLVDMWRAEGIACLQVADGNF